MTEPIEALRNQHAGETCYIVGKGPSLAYLRAEHIGAGAVLTLNEAVVKVEQIGIPNAVYSMQKDGCGLRSSHAECLPGATVRPQRAALLMHALESHECLADYAPRFEFENPRDFGLPWLAISAVTAIEMAHLLGCARCVFISLDACTTGNTEIYVPQADGTGITRRTDHTDMYYPLYRGFIEDQLARAGLGADWLTPKRAERVTA